MVVRRAFSAVLLACAVALVGARPAAKPVATPTPTPSPSPTPARPTIPLIVVFPFDVSSEMKSDTGVRAAKLFVDQINEAGGVVAIAAPGSVVRTQYLPYAKRSNADYYVAGYMTPLGSGVSLVEQVVSTQSGAIVFGDTVQIESFADAASQAASIREGIIARERSMQAAISSNESQATPTPMAGNEANIGNLAGGLFHHRSKATPNPHATPYAKPAKGVIVARVSGKPAELLTQATSALYASLQSFYNVRMTSASPSDMSAAADRICGTERNNTIATGSIDVQEQRHGIFSRTQYAFTLNVYTCFGARLEQTSGVGGSLSAAIAAAVQSYAQAHPQNA